MSAWQEALWAADDVRKKHHLRAAATSTAWLDNRVGGRLGVRVTLRGGLVVTGTPREIGERVAAFPPGAPPYKALADRIGERVGRGEFGGSGRLPATRELMAQYGVSMWLVGRARRELAARGVVRVTANGTFAIPPPSAPAGEAETRASPAGSGGGRGDEAPQVGDGVDDAPLPQPGDGVPDRPA